MRVTVRDVKMILLGIALAVAAGAIGGVMALVWSIPPGPVGG